MKVRSLRELYVEQLQSLHDSEQQLTETLPWLVTATKSEELRDIFEKQSSWTRERIQGIEAILARMGVSIQGKECSEMKKLVEESRDALTTSMKDEVKDAALISAVQRIEHYGISGYGCLRSHARVLGDKVAEGFFARALEEHLEASRMLSEISGLPESKLAEGRRKKDSGEEDRTLESVARRGPVSVA